MEYMKPMNSWDINIGSICISKMNKMMTPNPKS